MNRCIKISFDWAETQLATVEYVFLLSNANLWPLLKLLAGLETSLFGATLR